MIISGEEMTYTFVLRANSQITATGAEGHTTGVGSVYMSSEFLDTTGSTNKSIMTITGFQFEPP